MPKKLPYEVNYYRDDNTTWVVHRRTGRYVQFSGKVPPKRAVASFRSGFFFIKGDKEGHRKPLRNLKKPQPRHRPKTQRKRKGFMQWLVG